MKGKKKESGNEEEEASYDLSRTAAVPSGCTIVSFTLTQDGNVPASTDTSLGKLKVSTFASGEMTTLRGEGEEEEEEVG